MKITRKQLDEMIEKSVIKVLNESTIDGDTNPNKFYEAKYELISKIIGMCGGTYTDDVAYDIELMIDQYVDTWGQYIMTMD